jgi:hypothetical protein
MLAFKEYHRIVDEYLSAVGRSRGRAFSKSERARVHELVPKRPDAVRIVWFKLLQGAVQAKPRDDRQVLLGEFVTMALFAPGQRYPVPNGIVRALVSRGSDDELFDALDELVCEWFSNGGAYSGPNWKRREKLLFGKLPRGLRLAHTLMSLESEVYNGGFVQFFGNSSGKYARETLEDCRLVGAMKKATLLRRAMTLISAVKAAMNRRDTIDDPFAFEDKPDSSDPEFQIDQLADAYYALADAEPMYQLVGAYLRAHPEKCTTSRRIVK